MCLAIPGQVVEFVDEAAMTDPVRAIADTILYEGYVLWPYRRSALENAQRWTFGGVRPRAHGRARTAGEDPWWMQTQCLVEGDGEMRVAVTVRFLHVVRRQALDPEDRPVDELTTAAGEHHLTWDEAVEREVELPVTPLRALEAADTRLPIAVPAGHVREQLDGGALVRSWQRLDGRVEVRTEPFFDPALHRITVRIANTTPPYGGEREAALRSTLCSAHTILRVEGGAFVSLTDPPRRLRGEAAACGNEGTWPVLVGEEGTHHTVLSSPIILSDWPQIARTRGPGTH